MLAHHSSSIGPYFTDTTDPSDHYDVVAINLSLTGAINHPVTGTCTFPVYVSCQFTRQTHKRHVNKLHLTL